MPVPFRDAEDIEALGAAGYLKLDTAAERAAITGALFLINARGEPLEFTYSRVEMPSTFLWRHDDMLRHAVRKLAISLLETCQRTPQFLLCLADEVRHELFCDEVHLSIPVCRIAPRSKATPHAVREIRATLDGPEPLNLFWFPGQPRDDSVENRLLDKLVSGGIVLEPFDRALAGLREVYPPG